ncbi:hypothetical protein EAE99_003070 [Botrytis elliptica]|nr:hypothetical protein EAE99_003070 [Botrytis elliptica]
MSCVAKTQKLKRTFFFPTFLSPFPLSTVGVLPTHNISPTNLTRSRIQKLFVRKVTTYNFQVTTRSKEIVESGTLSKPTYLVPSLVPSTYSRNPSNRPGPTWSLIKRPPFLRIPEFAPKAQPIGSIPPTTLHPAAARLISKSWPPVGVEHMSGTVQSAEQGCSNPYRGPPIGSRLVLIKMDLLPYCKT